MTVAKRFRILFISLLAGAVLFSPSPAVSRQRTTDKSESGQNDKSREAEKKKDGQEKKELTKLFQLNPVTIEVVESLRDKSVPNMAVVKTELFPMTIGVTLDTALERQAGVDVQRIQEVGTAADDDSIKIRGMGARRIKVLRNGRPLNASGVAGGYFIDFTMIPLANADRVEVIKGVVDPRYGNVLGGVINIVPKRLADRPSTEVQASYASYATAVFDLYHGFKPGAFEYSLAAGYTRSDGYLRNGGMHSANAEVHLGYDFPFKGRLTADVGTIDLRKGFAVANRASKVFGDTTYDTSLDSTFLASDGEIMYGGMGGAAEPGSWWEKKKWTVDVNYEQAFGDWGFATARYWVNHGDREAYNKRQSIGRVYHKLFYDDRSQGFSASYRHYFPDQAISAGLDYSHLNDDGDKNLSDDYRAPFRNGSYVSTENLEFYVMDEIRLAGDKVSVVPGVRYLSYSGVAGPAGILEGIPDLTRTGWAPSLKLSFFYKLDALVYLSVARALRMPTAPEHFWHYDYDSGVDTGDLPFREEDGLLLQAGWRTALPTGTNLEVSPYFYRINHFIQFDLVNFVSYNIGRADLFGVEVEASHNFGRGWTAFANYSFQKSATTGDPFMATFVNAADRDFAEVPNLPAHKVNVGVQFRARNGASAAVFAQAVSSQKVVYNNNILYNTDLRVRTQAGYVRLDVEGRYPLGRFEFAVFMRNILDAHYQERFGFPAAGRNIGLSVRAGF